MALPNRSSVPVRLYFAYGSNLWLHQMAIRCPASTLHSTPLAYLPSYRWTISIRGYANVRPSSSPTDKVWGILYNLPPSDEEMLDRYEGVMKGAYGKHEMEVALDRGDKVKALVYIDHREQEGKMSKEYWGRIRNGLEDARALGMDGEWIQKVIEPHAFEEESVKW